MNTDKSYTLFTPKVLEKKSENQSKNRLNDVTAEEWDRVSHKYVTIIKKNKSNRINENNIGNIYGTSKFWIHNYKF